MTAGKFRKGRFGFVSIKWQDKNLLKNKLIVVCLTSLNFVCHAVHLWFTRIQKVNHHD